MRVLVLGGTGSIGAAVVDALLARRHEVIALTRSARAGATGARVATEDSALHVPAEWAWMLDHLARVQADTRLRGLVVHPAMVYERDGGVFAQFRRDIDVLGRVRIVGHEGVRWPLVHRRDIGELYALVLERGVPGASYNGAAVEAVPVGLIARAMALRAGIHASPLVWLPTGCRCLVTPATPYIVILNNGLRTDQFGTKPAGPATACLDWRSGQGREAPKNSCRPPRDCVICRITRKTTTAIGPMSRRHVNRQPSRQFLERLGNNVRRIRAERDWSQADLATRLGVEKAVISRIERGRSNITIGTLEHLAKALIVSARDLLTP